MKIPYICLDYWRMIFSYSTVKDRMSIQSLNKETYQNIVLDRLSIVYREGVPLCGRFRKIRRLTIILNDIIEYGSVSLHCYKELSELVIINNCVLQKPIIMVGASLLFGYSLGNEDICLVGRRLHKLTSLTIHSVNSIHIALSCIDVIEYLINHGGIIKYGNTIVTNKIERHESQYDILMSYITVLNNTIKYCE